MLSNYFILRTHQPTSKHRTTLYAGTISGGGLFHQLVYYYSNDRLSSVATGGYSADFFPQAGMKRLGKVEHLYSGISIAETEYGFVSYDAAGQRKKIRREDGSTWTYEYNGKGEVESGVKKFSDNFTYVPGHQFQYAYDGIGNRVSAEVGGDANGQDRQSLSYTANSLNQYTGYTSPQASWITGEAAAAAQVFVNGSWTWRHGKFFGQKVQLGNAAGPVAKEVVVQSKLLPGSGNADMTVDVKDGNLLISGGNVSPSYDDDGNLLNDGLWSYAWDAENRLKSMKTSSSIPKASRTRFEFAYDFEGKRIKKARYTKSGTALGF